MLPNVERDRWCMKNRLYTIVGLLSIVGYSDILILGSLGCTTVVYIGGRFVDHCANSCLPLHFSILSLYILYVTALYNKPCFVETKKACGILRTKVMWIPTNGRPPCTESARRWAAYQHQACQFQLILCG